MSESEGEIEYLDEDEEIVQHCVQLSQASSEPQQPLLKSLLVERPQPQKRKRHQPDDDSEYDPSEDNLPPSPPSPPRKKKATVKKVNKTSSAAPVPKNNPNIIVKVEKVKEKLNLDTEYITRKKYNIRIPDYDDPLCLPVRAIKAEESDKKRLNNWNNVCLEHFKHCNTILKPERGETKKSLRTAVFKNVINNQTGNSETTIWSKTCVENENGDKKSEIFQCVLPRYREKKVLGKYAIGNNKNKKFHVKHEVVLSREDHKDREALVVYKPNESLSAVYTLIDKRQSSDDTVTSSDNESKMYIKELTCCKVCAPCFQSSWRGYRKTKTKSLVCPICARTYVTIYNLLSHFKTHSNIEVQRYRKIISAILADMVGYHYKCRICRTQFDSIKNLRKHVVEHNGNQSFQCEICKRYINN